MTVKAGGRGGGNEHKHQLHADHEGKMGTPFN